MRCATLSCKQQDLQSKLKSVARRPADPYKHCQSKSGLKLKLYIISCRGAQPLLMTAPNEASEQGGSAKGRLGMYLQVCKRVS